LKLFRIFRHKRPDIQHKYNRKKQTIILSAYRKERRNPEGREIYMGAFPVYIRKAGIWFLLLLPLRADGFEQGQAVSIKISPRGSQVQPHWSL